MYIVAGCSQATRVVCESELVADVALAKKAKNTVLAD